MLSSIRALILGGKANGCLGATLSSNEGWDAYNANLAQHNSSLETFSVEFPSQSRWSARPDLESSSIPAPCRNGLVGWLSARFDAPDHRFDDFDCTRSTLLLLSDMLKATFAAAVTQSVELRSSSCADLTFVSAC